jgi:glutaminyl-peptide cyclotransferase
MRNSKVILWLRERWLEGILFLGFAGILIWFGYMSAPSVKALVPESLSRSFDGRAAYRHVIRQMELGPRITGSMGSREAAAYMAGRLAKYGWAVEYQSFTYRGTAARNVIAKAGQGKGPVVIVGAHYDTRRRADQDPDPEKQHEPVPGANDGASGVAVLLELGRALDKSKLQNEIWLTFFDAEDNGELDGWDWIAGSTYMARTLSAEPEYMVLVDMVGDAEQQLYMERNSTPALVDKIWGIAADLGYEEYFIPEYKYAMTDDHTPFLARGIPAVDIIDFDYPYWHTTADTADKVSAQSLQRVGRVLEVLLEDE